MIGTVIDHYKIESRIAAGGMGEVYRAIDLELERDVAIKCVRPELADLEDVTRRFRTEARTLAKLAHLNIATVYRFFAHEERLFLVMEFIDGQPFGDIITGDGSLAPDRAIQLIQDALKGLAYAHQNDVVHRDIKPGNLMVDRQETVKVLDFGIAHLIGGTRLTRVGSVVGTPAYMAPEQILGKPVDQRTDLYSIGIVLYEMLCGKLPYAANSDFELMRAHLEEVPRPLQDLSHNNVPKGLQDTIGRALAKDTAERFQSAEEFVSALTDIEDDRTLYRPPPAQVVQAASMVAGSEESLGDVLKPVALEIKRRMNFTQIMIGAAVALVVMLTLFMSFWPEQDELRAVDTRTIPVAAASDPVATSTPAAEDPGLDQSVRTAASGPESAQNATLLQADKIEANKFGNTPDEVETPVSTRKIATMPPARTNAAKASSTPPVRAVTNNSPVNKPDPRIATVKVSVHRTQGTGRLSRNAGYNGAFRLSVPSGSNRNIEVTEIAEVYRDGTLVRSQTLGTESRTPGKFQSKRRIDGLKTLDPGEYDMRLLFVHEGRTIGSHDWKLRVKG